MLIYLDKIVRRVTRRNEKGEGKAMTMAVARDTFELSVYVGMWPGERVIPTEPGLPDRRHVCMIRPDGASQQNSASSYVSSLAMPSDDTLV
jgi:hypothetical protein